MESPIDSERWLADDWCTLGHGREWPNAHQHVQYGKNGPAYVLFLLLLHLVEVREVAFGEIFELIDCGLLPLRFNLALQPGQKYWLLIQPVLY